MASHSGALSALAARGIGVIAGFAVTYMLGHNFGAEATGRYALVMQTAALFAVAGLFGLDVSVVRHFAKGMAENRPIAWQLVGKVLLMGLGMMVLISAGLALGGKGLWQLLFGDAVGQGLMLVLCLILLGRGGAQLLGGLLRSQHRFALSVAIVAIVMPGASALALASGLAGNVEETLWATAVGGLIALALGIAIVFTRVGKGSAAMTIPMRAVLASSLPLWGAGMAHVLGEWYGLMVAARMLSVADAGLYRVCFQAAGALLLVSGTLFSVYSAQISTAYHAGDRHEVARIARTAARVGTALGAPLTLALLLGGEFLLEQIGDDFVDAFPVLAIMVIGQFLVTITGPGGLVTAMSGHERLNLYISLGGTALMLLLAPVAAYFAGLEGLALCVSFILVGRNVAAFFFVRFKLRIYIWEGRAEPLD